MQHYHIHGGVGILPHSSGTFYLITLEEEGRRESVTERQEGASPFDSISFPVILKSFGSLAKGLETDCLGLNLDSTTHYMTLGKLLILFKTSSS